jgi:phage shock protein PspC (stress-responsive transcriptional regulator)
VFLPTAVTPVDDSKFFEAAQTLAQSLSQWGLLIIAGSLVIVVSTSYRRPQNQKVRAAYFLFIPMWCCLAVSIYQGIMVQRSYVAYLVASRATPQEKTLNSIAEEITNATRIQIGSLEISLLIGAVWLLIYIVWWICSNQSEEAS